MNNIPTVQINTLLGLCRTLYADYSTTTNPTYKSSLSTILYYKVSTLTGINIANSSNVATQISSITPSS